MPSDGARLLAGYQAMDRQLVEAGRHATSPAFMATLERFWLSGKRRLVVRKGRQGGGSTTLGARVPVATALYGEFRATRGTRLRFPIVSVRMDDGRERLHNIADTLDVLGIAYSRRDDSIELRDLPRVFQVYPCSMRFAVGMTGGAIFEDEVSRWWSDEANANPAIDVDASLVPSLATEPNGRIYTWSAPVGNDDFHASLMDRGEMVEQCVAEGPSWFWNPAITEADTHALQPDPRRWAREFLAVPQAGGNAVFDVRDVERAFRPRESFGRMGPLGIVCDWSSGRKDRITWAAFGFEATTPTTMRFLAISSVDAAQAREVGSTAVVRQIASFARRFGVSTVHGDQRESFALASDFAMFGIRFREHVWTAKSKPAAVERLRAYFRDDRVHLPEHARLRYELLNFQERLTANGEYTYAARGSGHDDFVSLMVTATMVAQVGAEARVEREALRRRVERTNPELVRAFAGKEAGDAALAELVAARRSEEIDHLAENPDSREERRRARDEANARERELWEAECRSSKTTGANVRELSLESFAEAAIRTQWRR